MNKYTRKNKHNHKLKKIKIINKGDFIKKDIILKSTINSIKKNWFWYISLIISCIILNLNNLSYINIFFSYVSLIFIIFAGWISHYISHKINFKNWFKNTNNIQ